MVASTLLARKCGRLMRTGGLLTRGYGCCCFPIPCCSSICYFPVAQPSQYELIRTSYTKLVGTLTQITDYRFRKTLESDPTIWNEWRQEGTSSMYVVKHLVSEPGCTEFYKLASDCHWVVPARLHYSDGTSDVAPLDTELFYSGDFISPLFPFITVWTGIEPIAGLGLFPPSADPSYPTPPPIIGDCSGASWDYYSADGLGTRFRCEGEFTVTGSKPYPDGISCGTDRRLKYNGRNAIPTDFPAGFL